MHGIYRYIYNCHSCYPPPYMDGRTETAATTTPSPSRVSLSLSLSQCVCVCVSTGVVVCAWVCLSLCVCVVLERDGQSWRVRPRRNPLWAPVVLTPTTAGLSLCCVLLHLHRHVCADAQRMGQAAHVHTSSCLAWGGGVDSDGTEDCVGVCGGW